MLKSLFACASVLIVNPAFAAPQVGAPAPAFTAKTSTGEMISLADFKGRPVVLEWTNHECPFVRKHYGAENMQKTQTTATTDGAVWISVVSSAPGKQGYVTADEANALTTSRGAKPDHVVLDPEGAVGTTYAAKTTPHMFIIDEAGTLRYGGAIDDKPSPDPATIQGAKNYVLAAMTSLAAGEAVSPSETQPYGCSVKYP